jgi:hypothetical protein
LTEKGKKAARQRKSTTDKKKIAYTPGIEAEGRDDVDDNDDE